MQRIDDVERWTDLEQGEIIELRKAKHRQIKLRVNAPEETRIWYKLEGDKAKFLALVKGIETVVFAAKGAIDLFADGLLNYQCSEKEGYVGRTMGEKFTKIIERQARNPEFERMQYHMMQNVNRRFEAQQKEFDMEMQRRDAEYAKKLEQANAKPKAEDSPPDGKRTRKKKGDSTPPVEGSGAPAGTEDSEDS
jgi:hypothetical protein